MTAAPHPPPHWQDCPHSDDATTCPVCQRARQPNAPTPIDELTIYARTEAAFPSECSLCHIRIEPGDPLALVGPDRLVGEAEWVHEGCAEKVVG